MRHGCEDLRQQQIRHRVRSARGSSVGGGGGFFDGYDSGDASRRSGTMVSSNSVEGGGASISSNSSGSGDGQEKEVDKEAHERLIGGGAGAGSGGQVDVDVEAGDELCGFDDDDRIPWAVFERTLAVIDPAQRLPWINPPIFQVIVII